MLRTVLTLLVILISPLAAEMPVLVSIPPIKFFVKSIGGEAVTVETLVPPGAGPHTYEPTPRQMQEVANTQMWFVMGEPFEQRLRASMEGVKIVDLRQGLTLLQEHRCAHCSEGADPHFWLSPKEAKVFSRTIANALIEALPAEKALIEDNLQQLEGKLDALDRRLTNQLRPCLGETLLVSHPSLGYFCRDYGLKQLSIEYEGRDPSPRQLANLIQTAREAHVKLVILDTQYSAKGARLVAEELELPTCPFNPLAEDYPGSLETLANCVCHDV